MYANTYLEVYIYIYIYIYMCVCIGACVFIDYTRMLTTVKHIYVHHELKG